MRVAGAVLGAFGILLLIGLGIGLLLPGVWAVERSSQLPYSPAIVFPYLEDPDRWSDWTIWPESAVRIADPVRGPGSGWEWDDPGYGAGRFTLTRVEPDRVVEYRVEVEEGEIQIVGRLRLMPEDGGSLLHWREEGDFGRNPLLGFQARRMDADQGAQMEAALRRLHERLESGSAERAGPGE